MLGMQRQSRAQSKRSINTRSSLLFSESKPALLAHDTAQHLYSCDIYFSAFYEMKIFTVFVRQEELH